MSKTILTRSILDDHKSAKKKEAISFVVMGLFCVGLFALRVYTSGTYFFAFLLWNLFLAAIPWMISTTLLLWPRLRKTKVLSVPLILIWVLFFPNAPYIVTDLFHLTMRGSMPIWFDLVLILSFAWVGLLFGFSSMRDVASMCAERMRNWVINLLIVGFLFLSSFGIYIGRYLRWNSWDIISRPEALLSDLVDIATQPMSHLRAWGMTLLLGTLLNVIYWTITPVRGERPISD